MLSHTSAAALWGFLKPIRGPIHVSVLSLNGRSCRSGITLHRSRSLAAELVTQRHRIPVTNPQRTIDVKVGRWEIDFLWPEQKVAVETDFFDYHRGSVPFEDDHKRELDLRRLGYTVRRYTGAQIRNHPVEVVADLGEVLGGGASPR